MDEAKAARIAKRKLSYESSSNSGNVKRRRSSNTHDPPGLLATVSAREKSNSTGPDVKVDVTRRGNGNDRAGKILHDEDSESESESESGTSSLSSDVEESAEADSSGDTDEISSSSSDSEDPSEEDEPMQDVPPRKKPPIHTVPSDQSSDLRNRLSSFIPQLHKANTDLQDPAQVLFRRLDDVTDDEEHYIEMNLGLGVLKEKGLGKTELDGVTLKRACSTSSSSQDEGPGSSTVDATRGQNVDDAPLTHLLKREKPSTKKPIIEEVSNGGRAV